jgi:hypothetical protein
MELGKVLLISGEGGSDVRLEKNGEVENIDVGLPVTQSGDPRSGGHLVLGTSKSPLDKEVRKNFESKRVDLPRAL